MCGGGKNPAVDSSGNHQTNHSGPRSKTSGGFFSNWFPKDRLDGGSSELESPAYSIAASASNSPASLSFGSWGQAVTLPKRTRPREVDVHQGNIASSSSSHGDRQNGPLEDEGYQFQPLPTGSYQDDDTGPSPKNLLMAVMGVKSAVNQFAKVLIRDMTKHPVELEFLKHEILREVRADTDRVNHWKFLVQAFLCQRLFDGFQAPNAFFDIEGFEEYQMSKLNSFLDFSKYKEKETTISVMLESTPPDPSFLGRFCFKKLRSIVGGPASNQPLSIYRDEWDAVQKGFHPRTEFYQSFLKVAVSVWLVHRLVHSFEEEVDMLMYEMGAKFDRQTMESVVPGICKEEDEESDSDFEVTVSVIPGFRVSRSVVKCEVYLRNRISHPDVELIGRTSSDNR